MVVGPYPSFALLCAADERNYPFEILPDVCFNAVCVQYIFLVTMMQAYLQNLMEKAIPVLYWNLHVDEVRRKHVRQIVRDVQNMSDAQLDEHREIGGQILATQLQIDSSLKFITMSILQQCGLCIGGVPAAMEGSR